MKVINKFFVIALLLSLILTMGAVAAKDNMTFEQSNTNRVSIETNNEPETKSYSNEEKLSDMKSGNDKVDKLSQNSNRGRGGVVNSVFDLNNGKFSDIQDLVDKAENGDTIRLSGKFKSEGKAITIDKKLNIVSSAGVLLDGDGRSRIFIIESKAKGSTIKNIKFKDGYTTHRGGAIHLNASGVVIDSCIFTSCSAGSGGAIATSTESAVESCIIRNSRFEKNNALDVAGAITYIAKNLDMSYCVFDSNYIKLPAGEEGGSGGVLQIGVRYQDNNCKITHCNFTNNYITSIHSNNYHGGVACLRRNVTFSDCYFKNNRAQDGGVLTFHDGGEIIRCHFIGNTAYGYGGVIQTAQSSQPFTISHSTFSDNSAKYGGAIYLNKTNLNIYNSTFTKNNADNGGAIYSNTNLDVHDSIFTSNSAIYGGAIYNDGNLEIYSCKFVNNKATVEIITSVPKYVNCSDDAIVTANFKSGNNILDAIWSNKIITKDYNTLEPSFSDKSLVLDINGKTYVAKTNAEGVATFKFNTFGFPISNNKGTVSYTANSKTDTANFNLLITKKQTTTNNLKKLKNKNKKIYKAYVRVYETKNINYIWKKYDMEVSQKGKAKTGTKKVEIPSKQWKNVNKKSFNNKYKWYKRGYNNQKITYFTGNVTTNINGEIKVKKYTKKHPYEVKKDGKFHVTHKKDWSNYVLPSTDCQSDNKEIIKKAKAITKGKKSNRDKANAILKWVQEHKGYDDYLNTFYGAVKSLSAKKLNCQDSALLTAALLRACNIPVKFVHKNNMEYGGHCWPKAYINGKWLSGQPTTGVYVEFGSTKGFKYDWDKLKKNFYNFETYNCNVKMNKYKGKLYIFESYTFDNKIIYHYHYYGKYSSLYPKKMIKGVLLSE